MQQRHKGQAGMAGRGKNQAKHRQDVTTRRKRRSQPLREAAIPGNPSGTPNRRNQKQNQRRKHRVSVVPLLLLLAGVVAIWTLYGLALFLFPLKGEYWDARGKFGDMFGAFNALFTACAFAALIFGIRLEYKA